MAVLAKTIKFKRRGRAYYDELVARELIVFRERDRRSLLSDLLHHRGGLYPGHGPDDSLSHSLPPPRGPPRHLLPWQHRAGDYLDRDSGDHSAGVVVHERFLLGPDQGPRPARPRSGYRK